MMKNKKTKAEHLWRKKQRPLLRFTLSYFMLLLIPLLLCISAYTEAMRQGEVHLLEKNQQLLSSALSQLESAVREAERFTLTLSAVGDITIAMQQADPTDAQAVYRINRAIEQLPSFTDAGNLISGYYLYAAQGEYALAPRKAYLQLPRYYAGSFQYEGMDYAAFASTVLNMQNVSGFLPKAQHINLSTASMRPTITFFRPFLPWAFGVSATRLIGKAVFFLDAERIEQMLSPALGMEDSWICLLDRDDEILLFTGLNVSDLPDMPMLFSEGSLAKTVVDGTQMVVTQQQDAGTGLRIVIFTPMDAVYGQVGLLTRTLLITMLSLLLLGAVFVLLLARGHRRPLVNLIGHLPQDAKGQQDMASLWDVDRAVHRLTSRQQMLQRQLEGQRAEMRTAFIHQLVSQGSSDELTMEAQLAHLDLSIGSGAYHGIYMEIESERELSAESLRDADYLQGRILHALSDFSPAVQYLTMLDYRRFILLYADEAQEHGHLSDLFGRIYRCIHSETGLSPLFFVGHACPSISRVFKSFAAAMNIMEINERQQGKYLYLADYGQQANNNFHYTISDEQRLMQLANAGRIGEIKAVLTQIHDKNFAQRQLSPFMQQLLFHRMACTLALQGEKAATEDVYLENLMAESSPRAFFEGIAAAYAAWCEASLDHLKGSQHQLIQDVLSYIQAHYREDSLGLASVALHFGITESYLSGFFKEKAGKTFSAYLEAVRTQEANRLLRTSQLTIDEIARQVGYTSDDSFRRAYKRVHGYTPSQHRSQGL